jgi:hypothetical protein
VKRQTQFNLERAIAVVESFRAATAEYFSKGAFEMRAAPSADNADEDVYRFRLSRRIPRSLMTHARRSLRALDSLAECLDPPQDGMLTRLSRLRVHLWRPLLLPGVRAGTVLNIDTRFHAPRASLDAPVWNPKRREVTVARRDPGSEFRGRMEVAFHLEFADAPDLQGQSANALLGVALSEAERLIDAENAVRDARSPRRATRHPQDDRLEDGRGS